MYELIIGIVIGEITGFIAGIFFMCCFQIGDDDK